MAQLPVPPTHDMLTRFFRDRRRTVPVAEVASLIGTTRAAVYRHARTDGSLVGSAIPWVSVADWIVDTWPLRLLFDTLGSDAELLPRGLQLREVHWALPAYIIHGLQAQAQFEALPHRIARPKDFESYVWDVLHRALDTDAMARLSHDPDFMAAYEFPKADSSE